MLCLADVRPQVRITEGGGAPLAADVKDIQPGTVGARSALVEEDDRQDFERNVRNVGYLFFEWKRRNTEYGSFEWKVRNVGIGLFFANSYIDKARERVNTVTLYV